jgi:ABC-2 type transport system ATP-binding protein
MTPRQFLSFIAEVRGFTGNAIKERVESAVGKTELEHVLDQPIDTLSKGFKRRVGLAQAILHDPPVLIMDEPTDGLDPNQKHAVRALLKAMAPDKAIVISTHLLEEVEAICTRAVIIDKGRVVADGTPAELLARSRHHNAVTLLLPVAQAEPAKLKIKALTGVAAIEEVGRPNGFVEMTAFPKGGALLIESVSALAVAEKWDVKELYAEAGRLDEVFRAITTHDADRAREARA